MRGRPYYKKYPSDFLAGTSELNVTEKGMYGVIIDLIHDRGGPIPDDLPWLGRVAGCSPRAARALRDRLIELGKIYRSSTGRLGNLRAEEDMLKNDEEHAERQASGRRGGVAPRRQTPDQPASKAPETSLKTKDYPREAEQKPLFPNDLEKHQLKHTRSQIPDRSTLPPTEVETPSTEDDQKQDDVLVAFESWNALAQEFGLPRAITLDRTRRTKISVRLKENGGLDAWNKALDEIRRSAWLRGDNDRGWRADLDFICQAKSFTKLIEGSYSHEPSPRLPLLVSIDGGKPAAAAPDPDDDWGVDAWCKTLPNVQAITDPEQKPGKWGYRGKYIDAVAKKVAIHAGFSRSWRGDWSLLDQWIQAGISPSEHIYPTVQRLADYYRSKGNPASALAAFDKAVRERSVAA